ncbi:uncharacterized protein LOC118478523 [Aplysia californica]|uniref:Uncharacterized protein LOC118478523 n=1 Tax=Aplysia californica TaxID=6500 RepID=A0ABM1W0K6_APLCA|nr:uncharacterized protein LOC118478523 [Aplysia californica]
MMLLNREIYFVSDQQCFVLSSSDGKTTDSIPVPELFSSHEEADTLLIVYAIFSDQNIATPNTDIIIRSPDTDVFLLMIAFVQHFTHSLNFDTGWDKKRRCLHIQTLCYKMETHLQDSILGLHAFFGCKESSDFVQRGKVKPLTILHRHPEFAVSFKELGTSETVSSELFSNLEKFVSHLYGKPAYYSANKFHHDLVRLKYMAKGQSFLSCFDGFDTMREKPWSCTS